LKEKKTSLTKVPKKASKKPERTEPKLKEKKGSGGKIAALKKDAGLKSHLPSPDVQESPLQEKPQAHAPTTLKPASDLQAPLQEPLKKKIRKISKPKTPEILTEPNEPMGSTAKTPPVSKGAVPPESKVRADTTTSKEVLPAPSLPEPQEKTSQEVAKTETAPSIPKPKIVINETITVKDLSEKMNLKVGDLLMKLLKMGTRASLNQRLDIDTAILIASEFGFEATFSPIYSEDAMLKTEQEEPGLLVPRSPIVTIMGHVDHGKTSLLDAIRETRVAESEAGGITQHIGAYKVHVEKGDIVFLDTPGHEAFTAMRARGAQVTDIVILVVAADDGVMPQTIEAIDHARAAEVPIIVAVNKIDLPQAQPERVKQELSQYQLTPEEWGGKTIFVDVSAKKGINIEKLLEMILLEAEILELKANPNRPAQGVVVEARLDPKRGPVSTVLVQKGTLKVGNTFVCGLTNGKVRALTDHRGHRLLEAGPSTPVEVLGFSTTPQLGEKVIVVNTEREAREIMERRKELSRQSATERKRHISLEIISAVAKQGQVKVLNLIVKADVQGSLEAIKDSIGKISSLEITVKVIHSGVGGITESDVSLAAASDAVIIGFSIRPEPAAEELARKEGVEIKTYRIIYEAIADLRAAMEGLLEPEEKEVVVGRVEVREVFKTPAGKVAGCMVVQGKISRGSKIRVLRDNKILFEGAIASLRRFKDDVREVDLGYDCGVALENFQDVNKGDVLEVFVKEKHSRKLV